jgi:hypothetical protein
MTTINLNKKKTPAIFGKSSIHIGIVKKVDDGLFMGRIAVWIPELGGDPLNPQSWIVVRYASPFAGVTDYKFLQKDSTVMQGSQQSYGFWMQPPDLENQVLICFANGDHSKGFWFACIWQTNMNHMVPGIASDISTEPPDKQKRCGNYPPVVEYNKWSDQNVASPQRPVFTPLANGLSDQGLFSDAERGISSSSARRESPSLSYGYLTPRGQQVYADDNPENEFIRMRTRSGTQVLIHETNGYVYINSKSGNSWIEVSDKGVDIYSEGTVSLRSGASLNLHADGSLNIEADGNLNLRSGGNITMQAAANMNLMGNGYLAMEFGGDASLGAGGNILFSAAGSINQGAGGDITALSSGNNIRSSSVIYDNSSPSAPSPAIITPIIADPQSVPDVVGEAPCYSETTRLSIVKRLPAHEPWSLHPTNKDIAGAPNRPTIDEFAGTDSNGGTNGPAANPNNSVVPTNTPTNFTDDDLTWLTCCIFTEAGSVGADSQAGVGYVVMNRVKSSYNVGIASKRFNYIVPTTWGPIKQHVLAYHQFSRFNSSTPSGAEAIGISIIQKTQSLPIWASIKNIAAQCIAGTYSSALVNPIRANIKCVMFISPKLASAGWAVPSKLITKTNGINFYTS